MTYAIRTLPKTGHIPNSRDTEQFDRFVGQFTALDDALQGARFLANSRQIPLSYYQIVDRDSSKVVVANIEPGPARYVYGAHMG